MMSMMNGSTLLNMLVWVVIVGVVIYGLMLLIMKPFEKKESPTEEDPSMKILKERFARGEIDEKEFKDKKTILQNDE